MKVVPAILEKRKDAIEQKMSQVEGLVDLIQVDVCDGRFVPSKTYASAGCLDSVDFIVAMAQAKKIAVEFDLMVDLDYANRMDRWVRALCQTKPKQVLFHVGSTYRWDQLFMRLQQCGVKGKIPFRCGLAVRIDTPRNEIRKLLEAHSEFEYLQIMGIEKVGFSGQKLSSRVYGRIRTLKRSFPEMPISIDGGVKPHHAQKLAEAGVSVMGMNSGLFNEPDKAKVIADIEGM